MQPGPYEYSYLGEKVLTNFGQHICNNTSRFSGVEKPAAWIPSKL